MDTGWKFLGRRTLFTDRVLSITHNEWEFTKKGVSAPFTAINTSDWVIIIPLLPSGKFVLVEQFRPVIEATTCEFPGGAINMNEEPENAAIRELEEETALIPGRISKIGVLRPNPAIMSNYCHVFLAEGCSFTGKHNFDPFEDIEIKVFSRDILESMMLDGSINHSIVIAAYGLYRLFASRKD